MGRGKRESERGQKRGGGFQKKGAFKIKTGPVDGGAADPQEEQGRVGVGLGVDLCAHWLGIG